MKNLILLLTLIIFLSSCSEKFNGNDEQSFKISREKIEKSLNEKQKTDLEKAMRVVLTEAMRLKWDKPDQYEGKSFNKISLEMINGLSYSSVIDLAEDILKERNTKEITQLSNEIDSLKIQIKELAAAEKNLNLFKVSSMRIKKEDFFDELVPQLEIDCQYIGKTNLIGPKEIGFQLLKKSTQEVLKSEIITNGDNESILESGDIITENLVLSQTKESNPQLWNASKYPIENPNLKDYDLELKVTVLSLMINGKKISLPKVNSNQINLEIKNKQEKIDELKSLKGTIEDLELTN